MNKCELCKFPATTYCDSDEAHLCWSCDSLVHGANFLVSRHTRTLLCRNCQSPTPWKASGPNLGPTVSFCDACATRRYFKHHPHDESEADNEAVLRSSTSAPPPSSSSSSSSSSSCNGVKSVKRRRESSCSTDLKTPFQRNDINHSFSRRTCCRRRRRSKIRFSGNGGDGDAISSPLKKQQTETDRSITVKRESRCATLIKSEKRKTIHRPQRGFTVKFTNYLTIKATF